MSAIVRQLTDDEDKKVYPVTRSKAVYMADGVTTIDDALMDMMDGDTDIEFNADGTITTRLLATGHNITTTFLDDGNIQEKCVNDDGKELYTKTTTFNEDGSISVRIVYVERD